MASIRFQAGKSMVSCALLMALKQLHAVWEYVQKGMILRMATSYSNPAFVSATLPDATSDLQTDGWG